jgi:hypothetical protein
MMSVQRILTGRGRNIGSTVPEALRRISIAMGGIASAAWNSQLMFVNKLALRQGIAARSC